MANGFVCFVDVSEAAKQYAQATRSELSPNSFENLLKL